MAGLQTVTTPVGGTAISSTTFGIPVANNLTVLASPPIARMRNSTTQSIPNTTATALTWDTEDYDSVGGHSTVTNTSRYTVQAGYAGYYLVQGKVYFASNATGVRAILVGLNGTGVLGSQQTVLGTTTSLSVAAEATLLLAVGDYVEILVSQTSGGALSTSAGGATSSSVMEVEWVHQ